jgi:hypothetical protein
VNHQYALFVSPAPVSAEQVTRVIAPSAGRWIAQGGHLPISAGSRENKSLFSATTPYPNYVCMFPFARQAN